MNETEPETLDECVNYIQANGRLENYRTEKFDDGKYYRRVTVVASKDKTTWTVTDYAPKDEPNGVSGVICKLAKALFRAKQEGIV